MQTFLPYEDFRESLGCLDYRRLGKQRVETLQILNTLFGKSSGWRNHPAVKMWKGYEQALVKYGVLCCCIWMGKGYKDTTREKILEYRDDSTIIVLPKWLGNKDFHASHRSNLLRKKPEFYKQYGWSESLDLPYVWPV